MKTEELIRQIRGILNDGFKAPEVQRQLVLELLDEAEREAPRRREWPDILNDRDDNHA